MKYFTATLCFFALSAFAASLNLYYGNLTNKIEKDIEITKKEITNLKEKITINELEFTVHTNINYLEELKNIYLSEYENEFNSRNIISLSDLKNKDFKNIYKVNLNTP
tara:strand:- start:229 stop:552 length:324 start_codon:yes stop_codon:yes gene_type:complete